MLIASRVRRESIASRSRSTKDVTAFSLALLPGGTISNTTGTDARRSRNGRCMRARMGDSAYLNIL